MQKLAAYLVFVMPLLLAVIGVGVCCVVMTTLSAPWNVSVVALLFLHPIHHRQSFASGWKRLCSASVIPLRIRMRNTHGGSLQLDECRPLGEMQSLVSLHSTQKPTLALLPCFVYFLLDSFLFNTNTQGSVLLHSEPMLLLPIVRVWAKSMDIHWYSCDTLKKHAQQGKNIVLMCAGMVPPTDLLLVVHRHSKLEAVQSIPVFIQGMRTDTITVTCGYIQPCSQLGESA
jgi:hypothetical protein